MLRHRHSPLFSGGLVASIILLGGTLAPAPSAGNESAEPAAVTQEKANQKYSTTLLGMTIGPIPEDHPSYGNRGTYVSAVEVDGPAAQAGVRQGYIIVSVRGGGGFIPAKSARVVEAAIRESAKQGEKFRILKFANGASAMPKLSQIQSRSSTPDGPAIADALQRKTTPGRAAADSDPAATTQGAAGAHFELESIRLGMTGTQIAAVLREKGYTSSNETMNESSRQFWLEKSGELPLPDKFWKGDAQDRSEISVRYMRVAPLPRGQWPLNEIHYKPGVGARQDAKAEQLFRSLVTKYGEPNKCRAVRDRENHTCTWTRLSNDSEETLHWQWMGIARPSLRLTGTNLPPAKRSDAQVSSSKAGDRNDRGRAVQAAAEQPKVDDALQARPLLVAAEVEQSGRLHIAGATLGMTEGELAAALKKNGFEKGHPMTPDKFKRESGRLIEIRIRYSDRLPSGHPRYDGERKAIAITRAFEPGEEREKLFDSFVARFGEPQCTRMRSCVWTRKWNGQTEELRWSGSAIPPRISLTYDD